MSLSKLIGISPRLAWSKLSLQPGKFHQPLRRNSCLKNALENGLGSFFFLIDGWSKEYSMQVGVWVKGKVCWCECWQIARRCRNSELPSSSCFLTAPDFFQRTDVQSQGRYGPALGLTMWVKYDASITSSQQSDYDSITEYRVHLIWSMDTMFDLPLTCSWFCLNGENK